MVHFFKLLLVTSLTCLGLVPLMPSRLSAAESAENVLPSYFASGSATDSSVSSLRLAQAWSLKPAPTRAVEHFQLASAANLLILGSDNANKVDFKQIGKWVLLVVIPVGAVGTALYCLRPSPPKSSETEPSSTPTPTDFNQVAASPPAQRAPQLDEGKEATQTLNHSQPQRQRAQPPRQSTNPKVSARSNSDVIASPSASQAPVPQAPVPQTPDNSALAKTTRIAKVDIVEALINDLHHPNVAQRRKSIWELGQRGDSRAIQPLVDLLVDADSQQRSLILAAIAEISTRALKPIHRALLMSLQDESADVRKNAIRDITRIYDQMAQVSQLLQYAASDTDTDVQETARWALGQLNRLRTSPEAESLKPSKPGELPKGREPRLGDSQRS